MFRCRSPIVPNYLTIAPSRKLFELVDAFKFEAGTGTTQELQLPYVLPNPLIFANNRRLVNVFVESIGAGITLRVLDVRVRVGYSITTLEEQNAMTFRLSTRKMLLPPLTRGPRTIPGSGGGN